MNKKEWQEHFGFSDEDMERIGWLVDIFDGRISEIKELTKEQKGDIFYTMQTIKISTETYGKLKKKKKESGISMRFLIDLAVNDFLKKDKNASKN